MSTGFFFLYKTVLSRKAGKEGDRKRAPKITYKVIGKVTIKGYQIRVTGRSSQQGDVPELMGSLRVRAAGRWAGYHSMGTGLHAGHD